MHERLLGLEPLTFERASALRTESERLFATGFLAWFGNDPKLYTEPFTIEVQGVGVTVPDFVTQFGESGLVLYEVTVTRDTSGNPRKQQQRHIYEVFTSNKANMYAIEVNGGALRCIDTTMGWLERFYDGRIDAATVQQNINRLGRETVFFQATLMRELQRI